MNDEKNIVLINDIFSKRKKMKTTIQFKMTLHHSSFIKGLKYDVPNRIENEKKGVWGGILPPAFCF